MLLRYVLVKSEPYRLPWQSIQMTSPNGVTMCPLSSLMKRAPLRKVTSADSYPMDAEQDFSFQHLTPERIADALAGVGVDPQSGLLALNSYEHRVYQFTADDQRRYVAKFYRPARWSAAAILEEHQFTLELAHEEVPAVAPLVLQGTSLHCYQGYRFAVFPSVGGRAVEPGDLNQLE